MKKFYILFPFLCCLFVQLSFAQVRYVDEVFTDDQIVVMADITYSTNISFLNVVLAGAESPAPEELKMNIYMPDPAIDDVTERPVIFIPTGTANPRYAGNCYGDRTDLVSTTMANKLVKIGYVVVLAEGRRGFNPFVPTPNEFLRGLAAAAFRNIQDYKSANRFLQKSDLEGGNPYGIDSDKMIIWGLTEPNSVATLNTAYLNTDEELNTPSYLSTNPETGELENVYTQSEFGNIRGTEPGFLADGTISNLPSNNGCVEQNYKMVIMNGGVALDTNLIQAGEAPLVAFAAGNFVAAPVEFGPFSTTAGDFCCNVYFTQVFTRKADELGNNDLWKGVEFSNPIANTRQAYLPNPSRSIEGLHYITEGEPANSQPWLAIDEAPCRAINPDAADRDVMGLPGQSVEAMNRQFDQMIQYAMPRACIALGLDCADQVTGLRETIVETGRIVVSPNPSPGVLTFETPAEHQMESINIYNISGSLVYQTDVFNNVFTAANLDLADGIYIAKVKFEDGVASEKIVIGE